MVYYTYSSLSVPSRGRRPSYELAFKIKRRFDLLRWDDFVDEMNEAPGVVPELNEDDRRFLIPKWK